MKLLLLAIAWIVYFPCISQNQTLTERWACVSGSKCQKSNDPQFEKREFARTANVGRYWPEEHGAVMVTFEATRIDSDQDVFRLKGNVTITTATVLVQADEADYHWDTGEIDSRGNVHVRPIPYRTSPGLSQFGIR